jgi:predicted transcriptional regulator
MMFRERVLAALTESGQTYPELHAAVGGATSQINKALRQLEEMGLARRERVERPTSRAGRRYLDWQRTPKVVWMLAGERK